MKEAIALVEHCKNFLRDIVHQIQICAASSITGALNGPQGQHFDIVSRVEGLKITNLRF